MREPAQVAIKHSSEKERMREEAIETIRFRAIQESLRTDFSQWGVPDLAPPASPESLDRAESELGFALWHDHRQVLEEIANGGFGPGNGLLGSSEGRLDHNGNSFIELRQFILSSEELDRPILPLCEWGDGAWSCVECVTGEIFTCSEIGLVELGHKFDDWLIQWSKGKNWWPEMFDFEEIEVVNPITSEVMKHSRLKMDSK